MRRSACTASFTAAALALAVNLFAAGGAGAQDSADPGASVMPSAALRLSDYSAPTPLSIPGAMLIDTPELRERIAGERPPVLIDTAGGSGHESMPGAIWLPGAGLGTGYHDAVQQQLEKTLEVVTKGDRARALVFFCVSRSCWLSYNSALRAVRLGYREVYWYRGGLEAWRAAGGELEPPKVVWRRPQ
jgi:PQQ-dependent catabolism-associated CXXCW motif protein